MRYVLTLIAGLLIGIVATAYFLGAGGRRSLPGVALKPPDTTSQTTSSVAVTVDEKFFNTLLNTIFQQLGPPKLKLSQAGNDSLLKPAAFQGGCENVLVLNQQGDNVTTAVHFTGGKIIAPLAFNGNYNVMGKCMQFQGTARASVDLSFDASRQVVFGALSVDDVALDNVSPLFSALVTTFVRTAINSRVNPFEVLRVSQLALSLPIQATEGSLKAQVKDVRSEIQEGILKLYLTYDFSAEKKQS
jgi:hypothetical protein